MLSMVSWRGALLNRRELLKQAKSLVSAEPGLLHEQQRAVAAEPERQLRSLGQVGLPQVSLPHALQQAIKTLVLSSERGDGWRSVMSFIGSRDP